ncbi:MAG: type II secretion system F family protein [Nanoarchaeota archaeon]
MAAVEKVLVKKFPHLKKDLKMANIKQTPEQFVKKTLRISLFTAVTLAVVAFFVTGKMLPPLKVIVLVPTVFVSSLFVLFMFFMNAPQGTIRKRQREIEKDVLFAGRYLLMKIESGSPIVGTLVDASKGYGVAASYFKEIVGEINTGVPVEDALENARMYTSSEKFKKLLWQLVTTLKTGTDVTGPLKSTLASIANEQLIEIKVYGKKLNSIMLLYMVGACVVPSLGLTMFLIIASFLNIQMNNIMLIGILFFLAILQGVFLLVIKASRPMVDM